MSARLYLFLAGAGKINGYVPDPRQWDSAIDNARLLCFHFASKVSVVLASGLGMAGAPEE